MEVFICLKGGYKAICSTCLIKIPLGDGKSIGGKFYCPICYEIMKDLPVKEPPK